jgi:bacterioferritin-associated ferredoxin
MIVCVCHRVSDRDIARAAQAGCASFDELQFELSVATSCGKCHDCARETFHLHAAPVCAGARADCGGHSSQGRVIPIAAQHHHDPVASAIA